MSTPDRIGLCRVWLRRVACSAACRARSSAVTISATASSVPSVTSDQNDNPNADNVSGITNPLSIFVPVGQKSSVLLNFGSPRGRSLVRNRRASLARALTLVWDGLRAERWSRSGDGSAADEGISPPRVEAHRLSLDQGRGDQAPEGWDTMIPARLWERALGMREGQRVPGGGHGQLHVERWPRATSGDLCSREGGK
jgi:hypothetical protein